jgi:putative aldouronate transport system permease protein
MLLPGMAVIFIFCYIPMYGIIIAFQDYQPAMGFTGSPYVGLQWFSDLLKMPDVKEIFFNTIIIAFSKIVVGQIVPIVFALLMNEVRHAAFKRTIQTISYMPYFLSWVVLGGVFIDILSGNGLVNMFLSLFGVKSIFFLGSNQWFRTIIVITNTWKEFGWNSILYFAALSAIDVALYEAAVIDGANRWQRMWHVTLPGLVSTIALLATLSLGGILSAGFEQIFVLYNPSVYKTGDIIDTFVYRMGMLSMQFSLATAVGLLKSVVGLILISLSYWLASRYANYRIF